MLLHGSVVGGRYVVSGLVASSLMSDVYAVSDGRLGGNGEVLKVLKHKGNGLEIQKAEEDFRREAEILSGLKHSGIVRVLDYFVDGGLHCIVMDEVEGNNMEKYLLQYSAGLPEEEVKDYSMQILDALAYLHSQSPAVIFRDLKPANCMRGSDGKITLIDFGIARFFNAGQKNTSIGTERYAAPEQYIGYASPVSDIYGLGATMFSFFTSKPPQIINPNTPQISESLQALRPDITPELITLVGTAMEFNPKDRYQNAQEMTEALNGKNTDKKLEELLESLDKTTMRQKPQRPWPPPPPYPQSPNPPQVIIPANPVTESYAKNLILKFKELGEQLKDRVEKTEERSLEKIVEAEKHSSISQAALLKQFKKNYFDDSKTLKLLKNPKKDECTKKYNSLVNKLAYDQPDWYPSFFSYSAGSGIGASFYYLHSAAILPSIFVDSLVSIAGGVVSGIVGQVSSSLPKRIKRNLNVNRHTSPKNINSFIDEFVELRDLTEYRIADVNKNFGEYEKSINEKELTAQVKEDMLKTEKEKYGFDKLSENLSICNNLISILQELKNTYRQTGKLK